MYSSFEWAKNTTGYQDAIVYKCKLLALLFLASYDLYLVTAISSGSSSHFDVDPFLNLPPGEDMLAYPTSFVAFDETEASSHPRIPETQQQASQAVYEDPMANRKQEISVRDFIYSKKNRDNPVTSQILKEKKKEIRNQYLARMSKEELKQYKIAKQERDKRQYTIRKNRRGYGSRQNVRRKTITEKVRNGTATPEETLEYKKVAEQKRKSSLARRLHKKQSKKKG
ncbi:uncharacterized protein FA14DRAFT_176320 [Meira miltonrushii]|uniref:Uncharacterized protein n=1 Tax=Meira miltonrushii TaxID=1280837 RepID=A0A316VIY0_9BASI|nr:uncharacterized protein FA14DRAFT_176320 [Meira miltonrushii]PWN37018.1 hypothetical protein FA14DRAFT_176320 [Meira miltonrushii]